MSTQHRDALLCEMGLGPLWKLRERPGRGQAEEVVAPQLAAGAVEPGSSRVVAPLPQVESEGPAAPMVAPGDADRAAAIAALDWPQLEAAILGCRACGLCRDRKQAVPGVGDHQADWLFVGEGPGAEEDQRGEPFVGQAGKLLDAMLSAIDLKRGDNVYIANAVKCRPPDNRTPEAEETAACWPYLERQIALLQPKLIVALGRPAAQTLLQTEVKIGAARGRLFDYRGIPVIVTYHPAYLLRNLTDKAKAWEDLLFARRTMAARSRSE